MRSLGSGVTMGVVQQLLSGLLPFGFHLSAKSRMKPEDVAVGSIHFHLLQSVAYSLCRDGFRRASLRASSSHSAGAFGCAVRPFASGMCVLLVVVFSYLQPRDVSRADAAAYLHALVIFGTAFLFDSLWEPWLMCIAYDGDFAVEALGEVCGRFAEAATMWALVCMPTVPCSAALAFAWGRLAYSATAATVYGLYILKQGVAGSFDSHGRASGQGRQGREGVRGQMGLQAALSMYFQERGAELSVVAAASSFTWQAAQKAVLQEATRFSLTFYSPRVAGVYGEVQNLGSLVVRLVFWPVESTVFRIFSAAASTENQARSECEKVPSVRLLQSLHRFVLIVAALAFAFGPTHAYAAVHVLLSSRWSRSEAPQLLAVYSSTLPVLASNGVLEAYSHARMSPSQLVKANAFLFFVTMVQALAVWVTHSIAEDARVLLGIDSAAMLVRIIWSSWFIYVSGNDASLGGVLAWLPSPSTIAVLGAAHALTRWSCVTMMEELQDSDMSQRLPASILRHLCRGALVLVFVLLALAKTERQLVNVLWVAMKPHQD